MVKNTLKDNWILTGTSLDGFKNAVANKDATTSFIRIRNGDDTKIASVKEVTDTDVELMYLSTDKTDLFEPFNKEIPLKTTKIPRPLFESRGIDEELFSEFAESQKFGFLKDGRLVFTSPNIDFVQLGISGPFFKTASSIRDIAVAEAIAKSPKAITLVCRTEEKTTKAFALRSGKYAPIENQNIFRVLECFKSEDVGEPEVVKWEITNFITRIYVRFPKKAADVASMYKTTDDFIPGIIIETSDTGDCSFKVTGCWYVRGSCFYINEVSRKHSGDVDIEKILSNIRKKIFSKYTVLPKKMVELLMLSLSDMSLTPAKQKKIYETIIRDVSNYIGLVDAVGKKVQKQIVEQLVDEFNPAEPYTAYDVATTFINLPKRLEGQLTESALRKLQKIVIQSAFFDYAPEDEIVLIPA